MPSVTTQHCACNVSAHGGGVFVCAWAVFVQFLLVRGNTASLFTTLAVPFQVGSQSDREVNIPAGTQMVASDVDCVWQQLRNDMIFLINCLDLSTLLLPLWMLSLGYRNLSWPIVENITVSVYDRLRSRNRCNHRDYHNIGVNGRNSTAASLLFCFIFMITVTIALMVSIGKLMNWHVLRQSGLSGSFVHFWVSRV